MKSSAMPWSANPSMWPMWPIPYRPNQSWPILIVSAIQALNWQLKKTISSLKASNCRPAWHGWIRALNRIRTMSVKRLCPPPWHRWSARKSPMSPNGVHHWWPPTSPTITGRSRLVDGITGKCIQRLKILISPITLWGRSTPLSCLIRASNTNSMRTIRSG